MFNSISNFFDRNFVSDATFAKGLADYNFEIGMHKGEFKDFLSAVGSFHVARYDEVRITKSQIKKVAAEVLPVGDTRYLEISKRVNAIEEFMVDTMIHDLDRVEYEMARTTLAELLGIAVTAITPTILIGAAYFAGVAAGMTGGQIFTYGLAWLAGGAIAAGGGGMFGGVCILLGGTFAVGILAYGAVKLYSSYKNAQTYQEMIKETSNTRNSRYTMQNKTNTIRRTEGSIISRVQDVRVVLGGLTDVSTDEALSSIESCIAELSLIAARNPTV